ncbi:MAG: NINE protein [Bacteroidetes bacterium]|nr:NINE protein [Bacteroidota bacterium]
MSLFKKNQKSAPVAKPEARVAAQQAPVKQVEAPAAVATTVVEAPALVTTVTAPVNAQTNAPTVTVAQVAKTTVKNRAVAPVRAFASVSTDAAKSVKQEYNAPAQKQTATATAAGGKSWLVALLLALFLGGLGIHRFYLGYTWQGVVQLLTGGGFIIWALIDLIRIIVRDLGPKDGDYID